MDIFKYILVLVLFTLTNKYIGFETTVIVVLTMLWSQYCCIGDKLDKVKDKIDE